MQTNCILSAAGLIPLRVSALMCFYQILSSWLNTILIFDKHCSDVCCDEFSVPQIHRRTKQVKTVTWKILFAIIWGKLAILNFENIKICG